MIFVLNYLVLAWTEPKQTPPEDNVPAPLNVGSDGQQKAGGLILNTGNATTGLIVLGDQANPSGGSCPSGYQWYDLNSNKAINNGECIKTILTADRNNVGIGTLNPLYKLDVNGNVHASGDVCTDAGGGKCLSSVAGGQWVTSGNDIYYSASEDPEVPTDSYTKFLLHADGDGNSFVDSSNYNHSIIVHGGAVQNSTRYKFGGKSAYFDGNGSYLTVPYSDDLKFGTENFTIDFWVNYPSLVDNKSILNIPALSVGGNIGFWEQSSQYFQFNAYANDSTRYMSFGYSLVPNQWYHVAAVRNGDELNVYINGEKLYSYNVAGKNFTNNSESFVVIGAGGANGSWDAPAYIDELRISKGIARWTSNFLPPYRAYGVLYKKVGIGTPTPSKELEVKGSILAIEDVCIGSGLCLSNLYELYDLFYAHLSAAGTIQGSIHIWGAGPTAVAWQTVINYTSCYCNSTPPGKCVVLFTDEYGYRNYGPGCESGWSVISVITPPETGASYYCIKN